MEIFIDRNDSLKSAQGGVYALGNFDGVHLGPVSYTHLRAHET